EELEARLAETGLDVTVRDDEATTLWSKLAVLAPIALITTWTAAPFGEARAGHRDELAAVTHEIARAARADGGRAAPAGPPRPPRPAPGRHALLEAEGRPRRPADRAGRHRRH